MTLPTFLGIGVPRAGTTWLHTLLAGHPDVYLPTRRKEIRFFDRYHDLGTAWYEAFFAAAEGHRAIGEISPQYLYCDACTERIAGLLPDVGLIVMLRHPVDRAYSNYGFVVQRRNFRGSFEEFLAGRPDVLEKGFYSPHLQRYVDRFGRDRILALLFEESVRGGDRARPAIARFLDVGVDGFPASVGKVNPSTRPRHGSLAGLAVKTGRKLRRNHLESLVDLGGRLGVRKALTKGDPMPRLDPRLRDELSRRYEDEFGVLERRLGIDLTSWTSAPAAPRDRDAAR